MPNEVQKFLEVAQDTLDIVDQPLETPTKDEPKETSADDDLGEPKRRREKRLMDKLQAEREANIAMAARLEAISEAKKIQNDTTDDYLKKVERIYGSNSPEAITATQLLAEALKGVEDRAYNRALETVEERQRVREENVRKEEQRLNSFIEEIEDSYDVQFTPQMEKGFFKLLEKFSPKDSTGKVIEYADPHSIWEVYKEKHSKVQPDTRQRDIAARSMTGGSTQTDTKLQDDAARRLMREAGII